MSDRRWTEAYNREGDEADFELVRGPGLAPGVSFSAEALDELQAELMLFIGTRIMRRWDGTHEPPSVLLVRVTVKAQ